MESLPISELKNDLSFTNDLYIDDTLLLLPKTAPVTEALIKLLKEWEFDEVLCDGGMSLAEMGVDTQEDKIVFDEDTPSESPKERIGESVKKAIENSKTTAVGDNESARMEMVTSVYNEYMNYIENVFTHYATHKEIDQEELSETVQELCMFVKEHRRYILRVNPSSEETGKNFLINHSMRTTVLAIAIGLQLHLPLSKMIELGMTCIIHEIGMLRLPPQIYMTDRQLTPGERAQITKHTILGYTIVKDLEFSLPIQLGVLEHHEKENGTGYPRRRTGDQISSNAKIIAVACSYEAISSPRQYKEERSEFDAMIEMIQNKNHAYDDTVIKALLYTVSLYPIGTYVYLSNRKIAVVTDTNPDNPKWPVVQSLTEKESDGSPKIIQTSQDGISIARILSKKEKTDILKILEEQNAKAAAVKKAEPEVKASAPETEAPVSTPAPEKTPAPASKKIADDGTEEIDISFFN